MIPVGYIAAPLQNGGMAVVISDAEGGPKGVPPGTYNYTDVYRTARAGEIVNILPNGSAYSFDDQPTFEVRAKSDGEILILYASNLTGITPMTIDLSTAVALDTLGNAIEVATAPSADFDAQMFNLIAPLMQAIDGRTAPAGFRYTLNITNATQLRPKHWFAEIEEYNIRNVNVSATTPCFVGLLLVPDVPTGSSFSNQARGQTLGLTMSAAICRTWAQIVRLFVAGQYPQPPLSVPRTLTAGSYALRQGLVYHLIYSKPDNLIVPPNTIWGCQFVHDTTGTYALANDPGVLAEVQPFFATDLTPCDANGRTS